MPGWAASAPVQHLIKEYAQRTPGDSMRKLAAATKVLQQLDASSARYLEVNPSVKQRLSLLNKQAESYLVHEFVNEYWDPLYVTEVIAAMAEAKLDYVGSATIIENRLTFNVPENLIELVRSAPDVGMRELLKDFAVNRQFRRDIYVKGGNRLGRTALERRFAQTMLLGMRRMPETEWSVPVGKAKVQEDKVEAIFNAVSGGPRSVGEVQEAVHKLGVPPNDLPGILELMIQNGSISLCRADHAKLDREPAQRLNQAIMDQAIQEDSHIYLASPVLGSAIGTAYPERLLAPLVLGESTERQTDVEDALAFLQRHNKKVGTAGDAANGPAEMRRKLGDMLNELRSRTLPRWRELGMVSGR
jgi:hypothetical protein